MHGRIKPPPHGHGHGIFMAMVIGAHLGSIRVCMYVFMHDLAQEDLVVVVGGGAMDPIKDPGVMWTNDGPNGMLVDLSWDSLVFEYDVVSSSTGGDSSTSEGCCEGSVDDGVVEYSDCFTSAVWFPLGKLEPPRPLVRGGSTPIGGVGVTPPPWAHDFEFRLRWKLAHIARGWETSHGQTLSFKCIQALIMGVYGMNHV